MSKKRPIFGSFQDSALVASLGQLLYIFLLTKSFIGMLSGPSSSGLATGPLLQQLPIFANISVLTSWTQHKTWFATALFALCNLIWPQRRYWGIQYLLLCVLWSLFKKWQISAQCLLRIQEFFASNPACNLSIIVSHHSNMSVTSRPDTY